MDHSNHPLVPIVANAFVGAHGPGILCRVIELDDLAENRCPKLVGLLPAVEAKFSVIRASFECFLLGGCATGCASEDVSQNGFPVFGFMLRFVRLCFSHRLASGPTGISCRLVIAKSIQTDSDPNCECCLTSRSPTA